MSHWWESDPARWAVEQQALHDAGIAFETDPAAMAAGCLGLRLRMTYDEQPLTLEAKFPAEYPYFAPMVIAPDLELARHQTPGSKQICLLDRGGDRWMPATDTLAGLLIEQVPRVLASQPDAQQDDEVVEAREGEPVTIYLQPELSSFVGFPSFELDLLMDRGTLLVGVEGFQPFRATVLEVLNNNGQPVSHSDVREPESYRGTAQVVSGRWVRIPSRPAVCDAKAYFQLAAEIDPDLQRPSWQSPWGSQGGRVDLIALLFEDELTWRGAAGNVIFIAKTRQLGPDQKLGRVETRLLRAELESKTNYFSRNPSASDLHREKVTLVGVGSVGSPAAKLLAQAGMGELRLIDPDILEAGNAIRWEMGRGVAGNYKVSALQWMFTHNFPYTKVQALPLGLGNPTITGTNRIALDKALFDDVDCILDASASTRVNQYVSEMARFRGIPYVWMHATNGAWGGLVGIAAPGNETLCWMCHRYYLDDRTIDALPKAPEDNLIQPPGCLDPTFTGSQVDLTEVSLMGTRLVIDQVLACRAGVATTYQWNVATLCLRDEQGQPQLPVWKSYELPPHPLCPNH